MHAIIIEKRWAGTKSGNFKREKQQQHETQSNKQQRTEAKHTKKKKNIHTKAANVYEELEKKRAKE